MKKLFIAILLALWLWHSPGVVQASFNEKAGIHILRPEELAQTIALLKAQPNDNWHYVTVPLPLSDLNKEAEWQTFFNQAKEHKIIPIVRLVTKFDGLHWTIPTRKNIVDQINFLAKFDWPHEEKIIIIYNEPNHAAEFGGSIDPIEYSRILRFASAWAKTENSGFRILPAGLDLAAPNGKQTMDAFNFLGQMLKYDPEIFTTIDYWNSHSYPNPGFMSSPARQAKNSMRGFIYELDFIKKQTGLDFEVIISETGWLSNGLTARHLNSYYQYTAVNIWSDQRIKAVTPFILQGDPGPFAGFSFLDREGKATQQYKAYENVILNSE